MSWHCRLNRETSYFNELHVEPQTYIAFSSKYFIYYKLVALFYYSNILSFVLFFIPYCNNKEKKIWEKHFSVVLFRSTRKHSPIVTQDM